MPLTYLEYPDISILKANSLSNLAPAGGEKLPYIPAIVQKAFVSQNCMERIFASQTLLAVAQLDYPRGDHSIVGMYAIAIIRYRRPLEEVLPHVDAHRAHLRELKNQGLLIASGPFDPRSGGALLLRVPDDNVHSALDSIRDSDPFFKLGIAQYELLPWAPTIGVEDLDKL